MHTYNLAYNFRIENKQRPTASADASLHLQLLKSFMDRSYFIRRLLGLEETASGLCLRDREEMENETEKERKSRTAEREKDRPKASTWVNFN